MESKPKMIEISAAEAAEITERSANGDLSVPHLVEKVYVDAAEYRAWKGSQIQAEKQPND